MDGGILRDRTGGTTVIDGASGYLRIDLGALARNYEKLAAEVAPARAAAVVKADAYGLGAGRVAEKLYAHGCRHFFVAQFVEALRLRPLLAADAAVFVLNGLQPGNENACARENIVPVANSLEQWHAWSGMAKALGRTLPAVLQFDTGMSRLGVPPEERAALAGLVSASGIDVLFLMSHLASADDAQSEQNEDQRTEMERVAAEFPGLDVCFANSGGIFLGKAYHGVLARPGIALYGGAPTAGRANPMEPVVSLDVAVVQTRCVPSGTRVGYGASHVTAGPARLATIAAGYADGLPRSLSGRGAAYCDGVRLPIVGRVSMDSITIDISALPEGRLTLGSRVEILGPNQNLEDVARDAGTIAYEILTGLGQRYRRQYR
ncbi:MULTISPECIES: alanine racemase [unclassified Shinella]|uniref:alanine racemase n=1 Tax=unclassified Shinella TaxID=2643062 RepID=UPI00225D5DDD|nr:MULTISPECIES: alanine racemase [unclassified Shinella]MCO5139808.1 alanine racemase [Shinella sp.]MDC7258555.1 alanine racemase [Shinella sp. YE25]CAI0334896.1 Alanine racemase, catabolic [Rhizobiaceae bacterium]CAK7260319.1 Alanine racemase, catabolic [Shinella sp. WSC3-e]